MMHNKVAPVDALSLLLHITLIHRPRLVTFGSIGESATRLPRPPLCTCFGNVNFPPPLLMEANGWSPKREEESWRVIQNMRPMTKREKLSWMNDFMPSVPSLGKCLCQHFYPFSGVSGGLDGRQRPHVFARFPLPGEKAPVELAPPEEPKTFASRAAGTVVAAVAVFRAEPSR